jgi:integrase/recombinase XerD
MSLATLPALLQSFFMDRLLRERQVSPNTIAGYRDSFRLLLGFAETRLGKQPSDLEIGDLDASLVGEFLEHLESVRGNSTRTRNTRLAAIHSFFRYVALREPPYALVCQRVLAIPSKRFERRPIEHLSRTEWEALLATPDLSTWIGRRDRTLLLLALQTGLRVSELVELDIEDVVLGTGAHVRCMGKGRKQRCTPLRSDARTQLVEWLRERAGPPQEPLFLSLRRGRLSRDAVERLVARHVAAAAEECPSLRRKRVTPHVLRHTAAMELLQHGVDRSVIALWLGHESVESTQMYIHADMRMKERALEHTTPSTAPPARYRPGDDLLNFLEGL